MSIRINDLHTIRVYGSIIHSLSHQLNRNLFMSRETVRDETVEGILTDTKFHRWGGGGG
jgi:hypothetical protein